VTLSPARLSLVIVNWNTRELLLRCLQSLREESRRLALRVIVVDNASTDGSPAAVASDFPEVILRANSGNRGFAAATNQGLQSAGDADYWGLLNPDTEVRPGALEALVRFLDLHPDIQAAAPQLLNSDLSLQPSGRRFPTLGLVGLEGLLPNAWKTGGWWMRQRFGRRDFSQAQAVDEVSGACFVARRSAFESVGGLDEQFFLYFEEIDWFLRLARSGGRVWYVPQAQVVHHWGAASAQAQARGMLHNYRSARQFWRKHRGAWGETAFRAITAGHALVWMALRLFRPKAGAEGDVRNLSRLLGLMLSGKPGKESECG